LQRYISSKAAGAPDRRQEREDTSLVISLKLDLLTNARVVDDAIRFVFEKTKKSSKKERSASVDKEEITTTTTTNQVF
jgi:hypothetical protein